MQYDFNKVVASDRLEQEIRTSAIVTALDYITTTPTTCSIFFKGILSGTDETTLNTLVTNHVATPLPNNIPIPVSVENAIDQDTDAISVTLKQLPPYWFPSDREVEFRCATLNSVHDKDRFAVDLNTTTLKFFNASYVELVSPTQGTLDTDCAITECHIFPPSAWAIRGAYFKQLAIPNTAIYAYIDMYKIVAAGPTYARLPYANGGHNLEFLNARESLGDDQNYSLFVQSEGLIITLRHGVGVNSRIQFTMKLGLPLG
jgi:hypothetical protein